MPPFICPCCGTSQNVHERPASGTLLCSRCGEVLREPESGPAATPHPSPSSKGQAAETALVGAAGTVVRLPAPGEGRDSHPPGGGTLTQPVRPVDSASSAATAAVGKHPGHSPAELLENVPGYEVLEELGRGGMGIVYRARQIRLNRAVALKVIRSGRHAEPHERDRFQQEAEAVARLQHPNIVQVHEVGEAGGCPFLALELCPGGNLARRLNGTPLPPIEAACLVETLARAVHHAHSQGVVHRDLKPANILLDADGTPKIADFGVAKMLDAEPGLTTSGLLLGTPAYMAPEQARGKPGDVGPAIDVYGLGAILYEVLTGRPPFRTDGALDTLHQVLHEDPAPPRHLAPTISRDLEGVCLKCLAKDPKDRYASAEELAEDLRRIQAGEPTHGRPVSSLSRLWRWCQRPERVQNAGALGMGISLLCALWCLVGLASVAAGLIRPELPARFVAYVAIMLGGVYGPLIWIGRQTLAGKPRAVWAGAVLTLAFLAWVAVMIVLDQLGVIVFFDLTGLHISPDGRLIGDSLVVLLLSVQLAAYLVGVVASRRVVGGG
jgi:transcription initiation factor TFIIIB Brf1 subunit/transcription initiation factor TFIIB